MSKVSRNNNLDFIRFLAATLVIFSHCYPLLGRHGHEPILRTLGYSGGTIAVGIFFVISGFLITASFTRNRGVVDFVLRRAFRILPALAGAVLFAVILGAWVTSLPLREYFVHPETAQYLRNLYLHVHYFLPGVFETNTYPRAVNGSLWTLPLEVMMYAGVLGLGVLGLLRGWVAVLLLVAGFISMYLLPLYPHIADTLVLRVALLSQVLPLAVLFVGGAVLYLYKQYVVYRGGFALACLTLMVGGGYIGGWGEHLPLLVLPYLVMYASQIPMPGVEKLTRHGDFSYGIYVYAFPIQQLVMYWFGNTLSVPEFFFISFSITLVFAVASWKLIEAPALALVRKFSMESVILRATDLIRFAR